MPMELKRPVVLNLKPFKLFKRGTRNDLDFRFFLLDSVGFINFQERYYQ